MKKRATVLKLALPVLLMLFPFSSAFSSPDQYDPVSGEPKCALCHTAERRYSIDYTRDETCVGCHGPGLSESYLSINSMHVSEAADAGKPRAPKSAKKPSSVPGTIEASKEMVRVPAGEFRMGSDEWWPKSQPEHKKKLPAFRIDKYEVTNLRYKKFVDATKRSAPDHWAGGNLPEGREYHPVVWVSWQDADAFCKWEGKRLPSEAEWEKAARGTDGRTFPWGDKFNRDKGNMPQLGLGDTVDVGSFPEGASPYGALDMAGNAFEWVADWFKPYPGNTHQDENYGEKFKVARGGSWFDCTTYKCGISSPTYNRIFFHAQTRNNNFGFRCAKGDRADGTPSK